MGVVNVTPDSFSDGARYLDPAAAVAHALDMVHEGADIIDIGGESTRPGAHAVPVEIEAERVVPVLEGLTGVPVALSVDTSKTEVMRIAIAHGADMINDVNAFRAPGALEALAASSAGLCIMHMQGEPRTMQLAPHYDDVVGEVRDFLAERVQVMMASGIARERIVLDPGFGFGKTVGQNYLMLRRLDQMQVEDFPWLLGFSRKSMLGHIVGREPRERLAASLAAALYGLEKGGHILR